MNIIKKHYKGVRLLLQSPSGYYCIHKFKSYMKNTSVSLGMYNSCFDSPSGASSYSYSTTCDLYQLSKAFFANDQLRSYCSCELFDLGQRHITNNALISGIAVFGRPLSLKTGTWGGTHKAICMMTNNDILCVMADSPYVFDNIYDVSHRIIQGTYTPSDDVSYYGFYDGAKLSLNQDRRFIPASTTKLLTALCVYNICSLEGSVTIKQSDIISGSGSRYYPNETFSIRDAVKIMLMESSNTLANALARTCGAMI